MNFSFFTKVSLRLCAASFVLFAGFSVSASVLGEHSGGYTTDMGGGAMYYNNSYSASVGLQTENYVEYTPNSQSVPVVVNGETVYGTRTIMGAVQYMNENSLRPLIGMNADFFSFKTGIPMGYTIIDGEIFSKENNIQDAIGFRNDGTAFVDRLGISASLSSDDGKIEILFINKWLQRGYDCVALLTDDFSETTKTDFSGLYVICTATDGDLSLNSKMTLTVDEVFAYDGEIKIPDGKYVFAMDPNGNAEYAAFLSSLKIGESIVFENTVHSAEKYDWSEAEFAVSSIGGRLLNNGEIGSGFEAGTAPRTAVGVKDNGNIIFYTLDGRQSGYSYGARIETLAKRMKELGCVDAINLDGGGSTTMGGIFPGMDSFIISNRPSDGAPRSCANFLFLRDMREKTGLLWYAEWRETEHYFLAGTGLRLEATKMYDSGNYKMEQIGGVEFVAENVGATSTVDETGNVTFNGTGKTTIRVVGEHYNKSFDFEVYETPEDIRITDIQSGADITEISIERGKMKNMELEATAYVNGVRLGAYPTLFRWETEGEALSVTEDGILSIKDDGSNGGILKVSAGGFTKEIKVKIKSVDFADMSGHWASDIVDEMAAKNIINGIDRDGVSVFMPNSGITRIQFAAIMSRALGINPSDYSNHELSFTDYDKIQPWAVDYVKAMSSLGYVTGRSEQDGVYFAPEDNITRAEAFTMLGRAIGNTSAKMPDYTDIHEVPEWASDSMASLAQMGIINGFEDNTIRPSGLTTRAEAAALMYKVIDLER